MLGTVVVMAMMTSCGNVQVPTEYKESNQLPRLYPDVTGITVPVNICPVSFELRQRADEVVCRYSFEGQEIVSGGDMRPDIDDWKKMTQAAKGKAITGEVFAKNDEEWTRFKPFSIYVSEDSIDPYITYRLISPSYVTYEELTLNQRCLENYEEKVLVDNMLCGTETNGQCVNCHNSQLGNPERFQFHARQNHGGTLIAYDGKLMKVNMKNDSLLSAGVYPAWHPTLPIIAYSTNKTGQSFHTRDINKIEVLDSESDLIVFDVLNNEATNIENDTTEFECFPCWSPDGQWLYYGSAHFEYRDTVPKDAESIRRAYEIRYNIYRKPFDLNTHEFGAKELVFDAASMSKSATFPRISPDGRFLLVGVGGWGCFHIWHRDADLWMMNLETKAVAPLKNANSDNVESFHAWSSNGRWIIFSSRRDDGGYTRPYIAHIDKDGNDSKAFELPTEDPDYHRQFLKSYNVTEFLRAPINIKPQTIADKLKEDGLPPVKYVQKLK